jgi:hypothetical protein
MKTRIVMLVAAMVAALLFCGNYCFSQSLKAGDVLPDLNEEVKMQSLKGNLFSIYFVLMEFGAQQGESDENVAEFVGSMFAKTWPPNVTPERFVRTLNYNYQPVGVTTTVLEVRENYIKARRERMASERDEEYRKTFNRGLTDMEFFLNVSVKTMAGELGLEYNEYLNDDHIIFTVSKKGMALSED